MRFYRSDVDEATAAKLVNAALERMHGVPPEARSAAYSLRMRAGFILNRLEISAPSIDCGMSRTIDELDLWTPAAKALHAGRAVRHLELVK